MAFSTKFWIIFGMLNLGTVEIATERLRPISPEELGVSLEPFGCQRVKNDLAVNGDYFQYSQYEKDRDCDPLSDKKLTAKERREERTRLRELYDSRSRMDPKLWEGVRDLYGINLRSTRQDSQNR